MALSDVGDSDEDLKLAIALSMQQSPSRPSPELGASKEAIDLTTDTEEDDDDMRRAIALSLQTGRMSGSPKRPAIERLPQTIPSPYQAGNADTPRQATIHVTSSPEESTARSGILSMDRKAMEQERLARLGKRKRDPSPNQTSKQMASARPTKNTQTIHIVPATTQNTTLRYPKGAIKRTSATKFPRTDDMTIDEVLQADGIHTAVISSFMWDAEWLNKKLNPLKVKQIWIMNAKDRDVQQRWVREMKDAGIPNLRIHFPPLNGLIHSMHSKLMLLFGKDRLRIVVPTANMTPIDWGEVSNDWQPGVMENSIFLVDLPRRSDDMVGSRQELTNFGKELVHFLEQQQVDKKVVEGVLKFDYSQTHDMAFVHAIGGVHKGELQQPTGLPGLAKAVKDLRLDDVEAIELDYASASLGAVNDNFLQRIYSAAHGRNGETSDNTSSVANIRDHFRIYFPTDEAVQKSIGGPECGGIISLTRQYYNAATFPRECLRNYDSTRRGMLSHNKLLFVRGLKGNGKPFAWVYVGSANMSESAWGGQKVLKSGQMGSLNIRNWECGVVMPVADDRIADMRLKDGQVPSMSVFEGTVEVPFVCPDQSYGQYGGQQPWFRVG